MSYTIDVYRGELHARRNLLDVAVFVSFFPHLVAGPIQRASFLLPQVESTRRFSPEKARTRLYPDLLGLLQEARHRRQRRGHRQQGLRAGGSDVLHSLGWCLRLRHPDLRRLFCLHGHRPRHVALARIRADGELRPPVHGAQPRRFLAALEHLALQLVPRLRLHSARRLALRDVDVGAQRARDVPLVGPVARRELELRACGGCITASCCSSRSCRRG